MLLIIRRSLALQPTVTHHLVYHAFMKIWRCNNSKFLCYLSYVKEFHIHWITFAFFKNSLINNAVINGPAAADTSISAVGQPLNPSTDGQLPTPFTTGPCRNGERYDIRNTDEVTVNGIAVIYHTQSPTDQVPPPMFATINWHTFNETAPKSDGSNGTQQLSFDGSSTKPENEGKRSLLSLTGPPIQNTQGTVGDGKTDSGKEPSPQKKETGNSYDYSTRK